MESFDSLCVEDTLIAFEIVPSGDTELFEIAIRNFSTKEMAPLTFIARADPECFQLLEALCVPSCRIDHAIFLRSILGDEMARQLARSTSHGCKQVRALALVHCRITVQGAQWLSKGLQLHAALSILDLSHNHCGSTGAESLAELVRNCPALKTLRLRDNCIGPKGADVLSAALYPPFTSRSAGDNQGCGLETLDLALNYVGNQGAASLASALHHNRTLLVLDVSSNNVGTSGAERLADAMARNRTLRRLLVRAEAHVPEQEAALGALRRRVADAPWAHW